MTLFYRLNPKLMMRYQPFLTEWVKEKHVTESSVGWQNGVYIRDAIASNFSKSNHYPEKPIAFYSDTVHYNYGDDEEEQYEFTDADRFNAFALMYNKRFPGAVETVQVTEQPSESETVQTAEQQDE